jgi:hypothetical protein
MGRQETGQYLVKAAEPLPPRPTVAPPSPPPSSGRKPCRAIYCAKHYGNVADAECTKAYHCPPAES